MTIELTEALKFYFSGEDKQNAIENLIDKDDAPKDFNVEELESFYKSKINALQVQTDFWVLLKDIWFKTWGEALPATLETLEPEYYDGDISMTSVWSNSYFYQTYKVDNKEIHFYCKYDDKGELSLSMYAEEAKNYYVTNELTLSDLWENDPEEDERLTVKKLCSIKDGEIEGFENLVKAAKDAVEAINKLF